jgi:peptide/nickel transport system permease protein
MARAGTIEALRSNYTRTAVLKGMPRRHVIVRHVLRNSLLPTITVVSVQVGYLVGGLVVIETLFSYPGIGQLILNAAVGHDLPTLEAAVLMIAVLYMVANFVADVLYAVLNPRLRMAT